MAVATFIAAVQSEFKIRLTFSEVMNVNADFIDPTNYTLVALDGTVININAVEQTGPDDTRAQLLLGDGLEPFASYSLEIGGAVETLGGDGVHPNRALLRWNAVVPKPIRIELARFSGEASGGILGSPSGQVFFSPAFGASVADSTIEVESVSVCTRGYDVYKVPDLPDPTTLFTFPALAGASAIIGPSGGVLRASAYRLGQAEMAVADLREDLMPAPSEGDAMGILVEPINITKASFLNDGRWRTYPGTGASLGAFKTATNHAPMGPGLAYAPFLIVDGPGEPLPPPDP